MTKAILFMICFVLIGCSAKMIVHPGYKSAYGPVGGQDMTGVIKYKNTGLIGKVLRRKDAYKQMYRACNGRYQIVQKGLMSDNGDYIQIVFKCVQ